MNKLEKLEEQYKKLGEEIQALKKEEEFVPGWYMYWDNYDVPTYNIEKFDNVKDFIKARESWSYVKPVTQELLNQFLPKSKTRYDWKAIIEKYPDAKYATTDEDGGVDAWKTKPTKNLSSRRWNSRLTPITQGSSGYARVGTTPDWENSLEERPLIFN